MQITPLDSGNSPLSPEQNTLVNQLLGSLGPAELSWVAGYLSGVNGLNTSLLQLQGLVPGQASAPVAAPVSSMPEILILYATQSGNAAGIAKELKAGADARGIQAKLSDVADYKPQGLKKEACVLMVASTHGEGDPPDTAIPFHEFVLGKRGPKMNGIKFSVLSLGDSSYEFFCKTGADFDERFEQLGGERLLDRVDCDVDFEELADQWVVDALDAVEKAFGGGASSAVTAGGAAIVPSTASVFDRRNPFPAEILENVDLNGRGSGKETRHVELSLEDSGLSYVPGDALGVYAPNWPELADAVIAELGLSADDVVTVGKEEKSLQNALINDYEITLLTPKLMTAWAEISGAAELQRLCEPENQAEMRAWLEGRDLLDLIRAYPAKPDAATLVAALRKMAPRLYSIASSPLATPDEVHLLIAAVRYRSFDRDRQGVCSGWLSERADDDTSVPVYVHENPNFRMPADDDAPMIMIGPGTGVAPFRAFVQHREATGAGGKNWLFFGDQHFLTDFTYQVEWQKYLEDGVLNRLDVAFSRDQEKKVYVQNRMLERSADFYAWLQDGAYVYVCGDESKMAKDVHQTLIDLVAKEGNMSAEAAAEYVAELQKSKRYQRDVY